ncbi:hypothetical protein CI238_13541 [Colletotrichum incanum]|uniref:Uncharacterized protein n=1 Tax=Colletotrichum incanum TaxID=1573173 RepID=A0A161Y653_COLIC|nr:hypothetical protein CI238_13541 [Colletotrichum incanum]
MGDEEIECQTSTDSDFGWPELKPPSSTDNGPAVSDWLAMDAEEAPGSEALRENEERERSTFKRMQIECTRQRRFFERVRVETALAREAGLYSRDRSTRTASGRLGRRP